MSSPVRSWRLVLCVLAVIVLGTACGGEEEPELTLEERLELIAGEPLTAVQVADRLNVASALCAMDDPVLDAVWRRLTDEQLEFQDFVISQICPDRSVFYAGRTGRYVTEEAENSGVVTSTTRPPLTTASNEDGETTTTTSAPSIFGTVTTSASETEVTPPATATEGSEGFGATTTTAAETTTTPPEGEGG